MMMVVTTATNMRTDADWTDMNAGADTDGHRCRSGEQADGKNACNNAFHKEIPVEVPV